MELRIKAWKKEQDKMSENFQKLCKCRKKTLSKKDKDLAFYVANRDRFIEKGIRIIKVHVSD